MGFSDIISNKIAESLSNCLRDNGEKTTHIQPPRHEKIIELINNGLKELSEHETIPAEQKPWEAREIAGNTKKNFFASIIQKTVRNLERPSQKLKDTNAQIGHIANKISANVEYCYELSKHILSLRDLRHQSLLGIDITPNCIYLCKIDGTNGKRVLKSLTSVCMEGKFMTEDIKENPEEYSKGIRSLIKDNNIKEKNVAISLPVSK